LRIVGLRIKEISVAFKNCVKIEFFQVLFYHVKYSMLH
jgi:hypothetical protein